MGCGFSDKDSVVDFTLCGFILESGTYRPGRTAKIKRKVLKKLHAHEKPPCILCRRGSSLGLGSLGRHTSPRYGVETSPVHSRRAVWLAEGFPLENGSVAWKGSPQGCSSREVHTYSLGSYSGAGKFLGIWVPGFLAFQCPR